MRTIVPISSVLPEKESVDTRFGKYLMGGAVACALIAAPGLASAGFVSADFQVMLDLPVSSSGARVLEALNQPVAGSPDVSAADEIANPSYWKGAVSVNLTGGGLLTLTGDQEGFGFADYDLVVVTISNIVFDAGESITGVSTLSEGILDPGFGPVFSPGISFTANSVTITFDTTGSGGDADFQLLDGGMSSYQVDTSAVPVPAALPLKAGAVGVMALVARRRKAG